MQLPSRSGQAPAMRIPLPAPRGVTAAARPRPAGQTWHPKCDPVALRRTRRPRRAGMPTTISASVRWAPVSSPRSFSASSTATRTPTSTRRYRSGPPHPSRPGPTSGSATSSRSPEAELRRSGPIAGHPGTASGAIGGRGLFRGSQFGVLTGCSCGSEPGLDAGPTGGESAQPRSLMVGKHGIRCGTRGRRPPPRISVGWADWSACTTGSVHRRVDTASKHETGSAGATKCRATNASDDNGSGRRDGHEAAGQGAQDG